jgi:hypothetical protein
LCRTADDCTPTQICANSGECASTDPSKDLLDAKGNILPDPFGSSSEAEAAAGAGGAMTSEQAGAGTGGTLDESPPDSAAAGMADGGAAAEPTNITTTDCGQPDAAITHISETLSKAASWQGEHVISGTFYIEAALDIAPCTVVRLNAGASIRVRAGGALHAIGAANRAIRFTSGKASKAAGDWGAIQIDADASNDSRFEQVIVEYGSDATIGLRDDASGSLASVLIQHITGNAVSWWQRVKVAEFANVVVEDAAGYPLSVYSNSVGQVGSITSHGSGHDEILVWDNDIASPAVWKNHGIPYRITDGNVSLLAHLEIQAGVTLKMDGYSLIVGTDGAIVTSGTPKEPVTFTSAKNSPAAGDWGNISFNAGSSSDSTLENTVIEYAGNDAIRSYDGSTSGFSNVTLRHTKGIGVNLGCAAKLSRFDGIAVEDAGAEAFYACSNTIGSMTSFASAGSMYDEVWVYQEPLTKAATWKNQGIAYRLVTDGATIGDIRTSLTLEPGVVLLMDSAAGLNLGANGSLKANGTPNAPITLKSSLAVPSAGSWGRLSVAATSSADSQLSYTNIRDGSSGALTVNGSKITLNNVTFTNSATCDVKVNAGTLAEAPGSSNAFTTCP